MAKFSQRFGHSPVELPFQKETLNDQTKRELWNVISTRIFRRWVWSPIGLPPESIAVEYLLRDIWIKLLKWDIDTLIVGQTHNMEHSLRGMKKHFMSDLKWWEVYDFLEGLISLAIGVTNPIELGAEFDAILVANNADHRIVDWEVIPFTKPEQIDAISAALNSGLPRVSEHLRQAMALLADRQNADYRNSIKESISAVECLCSTVTGNPKATLGEALKKIHELHPALSGAFSKLYGYTSAADGIRHALMEDSKPLDKDDAMFMLVACSAFTTYLMAKAPPTT